MNLPGINDIRIAHSRIQKYIHDTPIMTSDLLNEMLGCEMEFKCENFQKAGAFKYRGATNALLNLSEVDFRKGVATHSSGNHAGALAKAAQIHGAKAHIVMPDNAPQVKVDAVRSYGGQITFCEPTLQTRESTLEKICNDTGATLIHPYDNFDVICGQGTACLELAQKINEPDYVIVPVGGGGLLSGTSITADALWNNTKTLGAEPKNADDAWRSLQGGILVPSINPNTIADGLLTSLSELTFAVIKKNVSEILTVKEESIVYALELVFQYLKIIIEPSSAVVLASIIENKEKFTGKRVALIFSGGNYNPRTI